MGVFANRLGIEPGRRDVATNVFDLDAVGFETKTVHEGLLRKERTTS
jgi:hypothetical protein